MPEAGLEPATIGEITLAFVKERKFEWLREEPGVLVAAPLPRIEGIGYTVGARSAYLYRPLEGLKMIIRMMYTRNA
jgi:hypothetical protein